MDDKYIQHIDAINKYFQDSFSNAYSKIKTRGKSKLLKYTASIYRRWYYTSLLHDTVLTPANVFYMINREYSVSLFTSPNVKLKNKKILKGMDFGQLVYTLEHPPVVNDLKIFLESCTPDVELTDNDGITLIHTDRLMDSLSISDPYYIEYLQLISINMNLLKKIPSIYSNKAYVCDEYYNLKELTDKEIFNKITEAAIELAVSFINQILPVPKNILNTEFLYSILKNPISSDELFQHIYSFIGVKLDEVLIPEPDSFYGDLDNAIASSTFFLGIILDKYLYTPFGHYFKLINPIYTLPYDLDKELMYILEAPGDNDGMLASMYTHCSSYYLTELGLEYFQTEPTKENYYSLKTNIPLDLIMQIIIEKPKNGYDELSREFINDKGNSSAIYEIKVKHLNNKPYWKNMEFPSNMTLHSIFSEICYELNIDMYADYSFFTDITENRFSQYTPDKNPRKSKKTSRITIEELNFMEKKKFILAVYNTYDPLSLDLNVSPTKVFKLELELIKIKTRQIDRFYPRVSRISHAYKELDIEYEF